MKQLLSEEQLREDVARLAREITRDYDGRPITIVGILTGSLVLLADLIRLLDMPIRLGLVQASSYRGPNTTSSRTAPRAKKTGDQADRTRR